MSPNLPIEKYHEMYEELHLIGEGGYGEVIKVMNKADKAFYAAKHIKTTKKKAKKSVSAEVEVLKEISSPFIIKLIEAFETDTQIVIVSEYLDGGELFERVVEEDFQLIESDCCLFMRQICQGIEYLHNCNIVHLDIKPENIIITKKNSKDIKIIDLGTAIKIKEGEKVQAMVGTPEFVAPEVVNFDNISINTDQWSVGVLTFILLSGSSPFLDEDDIDQKTLNNVAMAKYDFDYKEFDEVSPDAKDFISRLLRRKAEDRMSSTSCLSHSWLSETSNSSSTVIRIEELRRFLARRKLKNVGRVLRAIKVMKNFGLSESSSDENEDK